MATENVDKMMHALQEDGILVAELQLVFAKIESSAGVDLTKTEKREFISELAKISSKEGPLVIWL